MQIRKLVNANKDGQDIHAARLTDPGNIVEVRYNERKQLIEFYRDNGYLGATSSKEKIEGYAQVKNVEYLFKGYHFTLEYYEGLSEAEMVEKELAYFDEKNKRKEEIRQTIQKEKEAEEKREMASMKEKAIRTETFRYLVKEYSAAKNNRNSTIFSLINKLLNGSPSTTEQEFTQKWWQEHLQAYKETYDGKILYQIFEKGELLPMVDRYLQPIQKPVSPRKQPSQPSQPLRGRYTHCWRCGSSLSSQTHKKCSSCKWLICSCGACKQGCSYGV